MTEPAGKGIAHLRSPCSVVETLTRAEAAAVGITIAAGFAIILFP